MNLKSGLESLEKPKDCKNGFIAEYYHVGLDLLRLLGAVDSSALIEFNLNI